MLNNDLSQQIKRNFPYKPTEEQENAVKSFAEFLFSPSADSVFLMKGYAGTGKTTLTSALVRTLDSLQRKVILLAPTGRAAKVFSGYAEHPAYTIHKKIYRQKVFSNETDNFVANQNLHRNTLFIVDEASMIANEGLSGGHFGSGRLLDDLVQYVYNGLGCRLMLIGDTAQLPPIGEEESPALSVAALQGYGLGSLERLLPFRNCCLFVVFYKLYYKEKITLEPEVKFMNYKILMVDDDRELLKMLNQYFTLKNYTVMIAENGIEAMEKISANPDIILLDVN